MAAWGGPGRRVDPDGLTCLLGDCRRLRDWARDRALDLDGRPLSLTVLDEALRARPEEAAPLMPAEAGIYAGTVMINNRPGARWRLWPNGHPVVRLASGRTLDVIALVSQQAAVGEYHLAELYAATA
jgi:Family of unknown function (DUF6278)